MPTASDYAYTGASGGQGVDVDLVAARARAQGYLLRSHRELRAMTRDDLSLASGVSRPALAALERDEGFSSMKVRRKLARYFGVSPEVLLLVGPGEVHEEELAGLASGGKFSREGAWSREVSGVAAAGSVWPGVKGGSLRGEKK